MTLGFFLLGAPGETERSIKKNIDLAIALDTDYVSISSWCPSPTASSMR